MTVYIDEKFRCHTRNAEGRRAFELEYFDGKCPHFVEGYRYLPEGESWQREDGAVFFGPMLSPVEDYGKLLAMQAVYESLQGQIGELKDRIGAIRECFEGLSYKSDFEQLKDFIQTLREMMEDFDA